MTEQSGLRLKRMPVRSVCARSFVMCAVGFGVFGGYVPANWLLYRVA